MVRKVVFDIETTGLSFQDGDRMVEFGAVEMIDNVITGNNLHIYISPEGRPVGDSFDIHGLSDEFLKDKPTFRDVLPQIKEFMQGAVAIAHNGKKFDENFINFEMKLSESPESFWDMVSGTEDTLVIAKQLTAYRLEKVNAGKEPDKKVSKLKNSLDALAEELGVDLSTRTLHGALIDSEILAKVYQKLTEGIDLDFMKNLDKYIPRAPVQYLNRGGRKIPTITLSEEDLARHSEFLNNMESEGIVPFEKKNKNTLKM